MFLPSKSSWRESVTKMEAADGDATAWKLRLSQLTPTEQVPRPRNTADHAVRQ